MCDLHKTGGFNTISICMWHERNFFRVVISLVPVFVCIFRCQCNIKILTIILFKLLCWKCWKRAAVHQRMIMVDDWDEDNELALLEPALEKAGSGSTSTSFAYSIFGSHLGRATFGMVHWGRWKWSSCSEAMGWWTNLNWALLTNSERRKAGLREVSCVFLYFPL